MPYRRLPNTDVARIKALKIAFLRGKEIPPFKLAFSQATYQKIFSFLPLFEKSIMEYRQHYQVQVNRNNEYQQELKRARMYVSHFIQVLNLAILRGDMPASVREFYGLAGYTKKLPPLATEADLIQWGEKIIKGEHGRIQKGQTPVSNPSIALVKVRFENFIESHRHQKTLQRNVQRALENLSKIREEADNIITSVWNEVEEYFENQSDQEKRQKAETYGVVYVFRKNELRELSLRIHVPVETS